MYGIRVLIADDNNTDRLVLTRLVKQHGADVLAVTNGEEAVRAVLEYKPDIILMDVLMPVLDGREAARQIRKEVGDEFIPLIFLTSLNDSKHLVECLEAGGDDFLTKPYNAPIISAKIRAFSRMRNMHKVVKENNHRLLQEQHVAKTVFDNIAHDGCLSAENIRYNLSPLSVFAGDVLLAAYAPSGDMYVLLGDFTGHGLPAAIGALPMSEIFYRMTERGYPLRDIIREINKRLKAILPIGFFCCAAIAELNPRDKALRVWLGGIPDCYLLRTDGSLEVLTSDRLPLGITSDQGFNDRLVEYSMNHGDRLYMSSDGIVESINAEGECFGYQRFEALFGQVSPHKMFDHIQQAVSEFVGKTKRTDDVTLLEVMLPQEKLEEIIAEEPVSIGPIHWSMVYRLEADSLKRYDPQSLLYNIIVEVPALRILSGTLRTVLAELFNNALEHGVLKLSSALKESAHGFSEYYQRRMEALEHLSEGYIEARLHHIGDGSSGVLTIEIEDSGSGFDYAAYSILPIKDTLYSGRGIALIHEICDSITYLGNGNIARVQIAWPQT